MLYGRNTYEMLYGYWSTTQNNEMGVAEKIKQGEEIRRLLPIKNSQMGELHHH